MTEPKRFADYLPRIPGSPPTTPPPNLLIRPAQPHDAPTLAHLTAQREGLPYDHQLERTTREINATPTTDRLLLVAESDSQILAFARIKYIKNPPFAPGEPSGPIPEGWYLSGLNVDPAHRRRGIGSQLTRARLDWIAHRAPEAFYFANSLNRPSIDLHQNFGFKELLQDFKFPGATFSGGGTGILYRADLSSPIP